MVGEGPGFPAEGPKDGAPFKPENVFGAPPPPALDDCPPAGLKGGARDFVESPQGTQRAPIKARGGTEQAGAEGALSGRNGLLMIVPPLFRSPAVLGRELGPQGSLHDPETIPRGVGCRDDRRPREIQPVVKEGNQAAGPPKLSHDRVPEGDALVPVLLNRRVGGLKNAKSLPPDHAGPGIVSDQPLESMPRAPAATNKKIQTHAKSPRPFSRDSYLERFPVESKPGESPRSTGPERLVNPKPAALEGLRKGTGLVESDGRVVRHNDEIVHVLRMGVVVLGQLDPTNSVLDQIRVGLPDGTPNVLVEALGEPQRPAPAHGKNSHPRIHYLLGVDADPQALPGRSRQTPIPKWGQGEKLLGDLRGGHSIKAVIDVATSEV